MENKLIFKKKALVTCIFAVSILVAASTSVPAVYGINISENITKSEHKNDFIYKDLESEWNIYIDDLVKILNLLDNKEILKDIQDFKYSDFLKVYTQVGSPKLNIVNYLKVLKNELIPTILEIKNEINHKELSTTFIEKNNILKENKIISENLLNVPPSGGFSWYWDKYEENIEKYWEKWQVESWQDWWDAIGAFGEVILRNNVMPLAMSFILAWLPFPASLVGWFLIAYVLVALYDFQDLVRAGQVAYSVMNVNQVDIIIRVVYEKDNITYGVPNLHKKLIYGKNDDAIKLCDNSLGKKEEFFTYYFGPGDYYGGLNGTGWYRLMNRDDSETKNRDLDEKAQHPPGNWTITIPETDLYNGTTLTIPYTELPRKGIYINETVKVELKPR